MGPHQLGGLVDRLEADGVDSLQQRQRLVEDFAPSVGTQSDAEADLDE